MSSPSPLRLSLTARFGRRAMVAGALGGLLMARGAAAQDDAAGNTPQLAESPTIKPTGRGDVPSWGGRRPGPFAAGSLRPEEPLGATPVALVIPTIGIDAPVEVLQVTDGTMQDPTGPWVVGWYEDLGRLGTGTNVVMAGHVDYWNVGPSVFFNLTQLQPGETITVLGNDGGEFDYAVMDVTLYSVDEAPIDEIVGSTGSDMLTLITCGGTFDYQTGQYLQRTVVRAERVAG